MSMTDSEVIERILYMGVGRRGLENENSCISKELNELKQYRAISTVEELRELKEKGTAKKPIPLDKYGECHECPTCGGYAENNCGCAYRFCPTCGTEFDWSEGKE